MQETIGYLTVDNALADYAELLLALRLQLNVSQVVTFGGSYGALLSAWMRFRYPQIVTGAIASAAPTHFFGDTYGWAAAATAAFAARSVNCSTSIRSLFGRLFEEAQQNKTNDW